VQSPRFSTRKAETSLVIKSGHTISLGGIIKEKDDTTIRKIPLLGDIPFLGNLFKSTSISSSRTELMMLITPYIANNAEDADALTDAFKKKLKELEPLLSQKRTEIEKN
jgi:type II secretory pathway component GspD/PulD (secretin)